MSVMARSDDGRWRPVSEQGPVPPQFLTQLTGEDVAPLFGLEEPTFVMAATLDEAGAAEAVCVTASGALVLIIAAGEEGSEALERRIEEAVFDVSALTLVEFMGRCAQLGSQHTVGTWVVDRAGTGDPLQVDASVREALNRGEMTVFVAARFGLASVALAVTEARSALTAPIRCFELLWLGTPGVDLVETWKVPEVDLREAARAATRRANADDMLRSVERKLGAGSVPLASALLNFCVAFFCEVTFHATPRRVVVQGWLEHEGTRIRVIELDSSGALTIAIDHLDAMDRRELLEALVGVVGDDRFGVDQDRTEAVELSLTNDLGDVSLVEQLIGAVCDGHLSTMGQALARAKRWGHAAA